MTEPEAVSSEIPLPTVQNASLREIAFLFLKLESVSFGGPAAHITMMEAEVVRRRRWLSGEEFLDLLGATNLISVPNSTELAIHIGHRQAGWPGLLVAGSCFILPAVSIVSDIRRAGHLKKTHLSLLIVHFSFSIEKLK
jgi:chromate transporter